MAKEIHNPKVYADSQQPSSGVDSENASKDYNKTTNRDRGVLK